MTYKILIKPSKTASNYSYYSQQINNEIVEYSTEHLTDLAEKYKELLGSYTTEQIRLVHELEPEIVINVAETSDTSIETDTESDDEI